MVGAIFGRYQLKNWRITKMMSRKDYNETARILNKYKNLISSDVFVDLADDFSFMFEKDNPNFKSEIFFEKVNG